MKKAIFLDKDGTLIEDIPYNVDRELIRFTEGAVEALRKLQAEGFLLIVVSNQSGVAHGFFSEEALHHLGHSLSEMLLQSGVKLDGFLYCPHHPQGIIGAYTKICDCRKPKAGMLLDAAAKFRINLQASWMVGDILNDVEAGNRAGCKTILIDNGNETEWTISDWRRPTAVVRNIGEAAELIIHNFSEAI